MCLLMTLKLSQEEEKCMGRGGGCLILLAINEERAQPGLAQDACVLGWEHI